MARCCPGGMCRIVVCRLPWCPAVATAVRVPARGPHLESSAVHMRPVHCRGAPASACRRRGGAQVASRRKCFGSYPSGGARIAYASPDSWEIPPRGTAKNDGTGILAVSAGQPAVWEVSRALRLSQFIIRSPALSAEGREFESPRPEQCLRRDTLDFVSVPACAMYSEWGSPRQALESRVVTIRGDPLATGLDGQSRKPGVLRNVSRGLGILAQGLEYRPVTLAGHNDRRGRLSEDDARKLERVIQGTRTCKNPPMSTDADEAGEHLRCDAIGRRSVDHRFQPCLVSRMFLGI